MRVQNAIIMAAGTSSRFAPLSYERPKALVEVRGEVLIERQIRQLREAGVGEVHVVTGYEAEQLAYLADEFGVGLIHNPSYLTRNNHASIWAAREVLGATYVCSADNYFCENPFESEVDDAYYAAVYADGPTEEWCMEEDERGYVSSVTIGGRDAWYMLGHTFWSPTFSEGFLRILERENDLPQTADKLWEQLYREHLDVLKMRMRRYPEGVICEFDTLDELRGFDESYLDDTRSALLKEVAARLGVQERSIADIAPLRGSSTAAEGFTCRVDGQEYSYRYADGSLARRRPTA